MNIGSESNTDNPYPARKYRKYLRDKTPWILAGLLAVVLIHFSQLLSGERAKVRELDSQIESLKAEIGKIVRQQEQHSNHYSSRLEQIQIEARLLQEQTTEALDKTQSTIQSNQSSLADNKRLFNLKSFIDDLTGAHVRVYYYKGEKIDTRSQYIDFIREKIIGYTKGADSAFIRENRYYYYDLMAALVIYGSKKTEYKPAWNSMRLDGKNPVFVAIIETFQNELQIRESQTMMASLEEIHRNATAGEDLPLVSKR